MTCDEENQGVIEAVADALRNRVGVSRLSGRQYDIDLAMVAIAAYKKWERRKDKG